MDTTTLPLVVALASVVPPVIVWLKLRRKQQYKRLALFEEMVDKARSDPDQRVIARTKAEERALGEFLVQRDRQARLARRANAVGARIRMIGTLLPVGDEWRIEEMVNHRNELRDEYGRVPRFHYTRLLLSALEIRWEARVYPERQVD